MKAITIRQPHASLILAGLKRFETRTWATRHRGPLIIHAGMSLGALPQGWHWTDDGKVCCGEVVLDCPRGVALGAVDLIDVVPTEELDLDEAQRPFGNFSKGRFAWELSDPSRFAQPVKAAGKLGLWEWSYTV